MLADRETIVVDDGSRDGTVAAIQSSCQGVEILRHEASRGFSVAANAGLRQARGPIRLLLNSDTELDPGALDAVLAAFRSDPRLGIAGAQLRYADGRPQWSGGAMPSLTWLFAQASHVHVALSRLPLYRTVRPLETLRDREVDWVTGAAMAMRREVWDQIGPLDERFALYAQDLDFCVRARQAGWRVAIVPGFSV